MAATWVLVALWAAFALVRSFGLERDFPLVPLLAFTPYITLATLIPLALALVLRLWGAATIAAVAAALLAALVLPRAFAGGGPEIEDGVPLRVLTTNVLAGDADPKFIAELVEKLDVDLLSVQELTPAYANELRRALGDRLPYEVLRPLPKVAGSGILSARPLREVSPNELLPGGFALPRARFELAGAGTVELLAIHVHPPIPWGASEWGEDLRSLPEAADSPLRLMLGDFNATFDHAEFRAVLDRGYTDAADAAGAGLTPTWAEGRRLPPLLTIDHVLADERIAVGDLSVYSVPGSDHRAVFAELVLPRER